MIHDRSNSRAEKPCHVCAHPLRDHAVKGTERYGARIYCLAPLCGCDRETGPVAATLAIFVGRTVRALGAR